MNTRTSVEELIHEITSPNHKVTGEIVKIVEREERWSHEVNNQRQKMIKDKDIRAMYVSIKNKFDRMSKDIFVSKMDFVLKAYKENIKHKA